VIGGDRYGIDGVELVLAEPQKALQEALYVEGTVSTLSRLTPKIKWANCSMFDPGERNLGEDDGLSKTTLTNTVGQR